MKCQTDEVVAIAIGAQSNSRITRFFKQQAAHLSQHKDVSQLEVKGGEVWLFSYGVIVCWGLNQDERTNWISELLEFMEKPMESFEEDCFRFVEGEKDTINNDLITLKHNDALSRQAISHALAQSVKLAVLESRAQSTITRHESIPQSLALHGSTRLSRKQIARIRGQLFSTKSDIILNYGLLDTPEFFWDHPELQAMYQQLAQYLEISVRVNLLAKKLETIHELFTMLADEQKHRHSSMLEWLIIILIAIDIIIVTVPEVLGRGH